MLDYARHSKVRTHAVSEILYPGRTGRGNYVEDALIQDIDSSRRGNRRHQEIQLANIIGKIVRVAGQVEHVNTSTLSHVYAAPAESLRSVAVKRHERKSNERL